MSLGHGVKIVRSGLIFHADAGSVRSYPGTGVAWNDLSGNNLNLTLYNGASISNNSLILDGANDYAAVGYTFDWTSIPWTVSFFAKTTDFTYPAVIDLIVAGNGHFRFNLSNSYISVAFRTPGGTASSLVFHSTTINSGQWYNCAFTRLGDTFKAYLNGELRQTSTSTAFSGSTGMTAIRIGYSADYDAEDRTFQGEVGLVMIHNNALTDSEVKQNFNALRGRYGI